MAKTAAERQTAYRVRRGDRRLNTWIRSATDLALEHLARRYGVTKREMIERLTTAADDEVLRPLALDTPAWDACFSVTR